MLKVKCDACGSPYEVDPRRIPKSGLKMRCSSCGAQVFVSPPGSPAEPAKQDASLSADLPAPKRGSSSAFGLELDLPAPKAQTSADQAPKPGLPKAPLAAPLADLPAPKGPAAGLPLPAPAFSPKRPGLSNDSFPKDSLAIDPEPLFGIEPSALSNLDDVMRAAAPKAVASADKPKVALPAAPAAPAPKVGGSLPRDSLDLPQGFAGLGDAPVELVGLPFEAGAPAAPKAEPKTPLATPFDDIDLPAPLAGPAAIAVSTKAASPKPFAHPGQMSRDSLDLPPPQQSAGRIPTQADSPSLAPDFEFDLPAPKGAASAAPTPDLVDLPAPARAPQKPAGFAPDFELDLPAPAAPRAAQKPAGFAPDFELDLPAPAAPRAAQKPAASASEFELDLPAPVQDLPAPLSANKPALPKATAPEPMNSTMALSIDDLQLPQPTLSDPDGEALSLPSLSDVPGPLLDELPLDPFTDVGASQARPQTMDLDSLLEPTPRAPKAAGKHHGVAGGSAFGELDFGLPEEGARPSDLPVPAALPLPLPAPVPAEASSLVPGADAVTEPEAAEADLAKSKKKKKAKGPKKPIPAWVWPVGIVTALVGTGVTMGLATDYGWFGVYLVEQFLPEAGDPRRVAEAIAAAEQRAASDTHADLRKSLLMLSDARNEAGLNRELLARSLLHESLYLLRFEDDMNSAQRSVAILTRVMERGTAVNGLALARAAHAARTNDFAAARSLLAQHDNPNDPYAGLVAGELALREQKYDAAIEAFTRALNNGASARAAWGIARAHIEKKDLEAADAASQQTLKLSPRHAGALIWSGERALARGDLAAAKTFAKQALGWVDLAGKRVRPSKAERARAYALTGLVEERSEHPSEAQAAYEEALKLDPHRLDVLLGSGRMLMRLGRAKEALTRYDSALSLKATSPDAKSPTFVEAGVGAAQALLVLERGREALERLERLKAENPEHFEVQLWLGHAQESLELWDEAEASYKRSIELSPDTFSGYVGLSQLLFKRKRPEEASRVLADATGKVKDSAEVRRMLGNSELARNHLSEAIAHFTSALRFDSNDAGALFGLSVAQRKNGELDAAEKNLVRLAGIDPSFPGLATEHGLLRETRGDHAGAAEVYRAALEKRPQDIDLKLRLGAALVASDKIDEADGLLREVIKERPSSAEGEYFLGRILFARNDMAQALQHFERAVQLDPMRAEFRTYFAWSHLEHGNLSGALTQINTAVERDPNSGDAHWILGRVQLRMGAVKDALESFQKALRLKPGRYEALAGLGDAYDQLRELRKAIKAYEDAVRAVPNQGFWWYRLASLHSDKGHRDEARKAFAEAVLHGDRLATKPAWVADAHYAYAEALRDAKRNAEALDQYRTFLEIAPAGHAARDEVTRLVRSLQR